MDMPSARSMQEYTPVNSNENAYFSNQYKAFFEMISEGIWHMIIHPPLPQDQPTEHQIEHLLQHAYLAECNQIFAELNQASTPQELTGAPLHTLFPTFAERMLKDWIASGYALKNALYILYTADKEPIHVMANIVGTFNAQGELAHIWGSFIDVSERIQLEQRIVQALEEQQKRIGRDLHDGLGQFITGLRMLSENLVHALDADNSPHLGAIQRIAELAADAQEQLRKVYRGLTPVELYHEGLAAALSRLAYTINELPGVECGFLYDYQADIWDMETKTQLFRIAQEAVNNALKHAKPDRIAISLTTENKITTLTIRDNGLGFDQQNTSSNFGASLGLRSMQYRAHVIDADLTIKSQPGKGTIVQCAIHYS